MSKNFTLIATAVLAMLGSGCKKYEAAWTQKIENKERASKTDLHEILNGFRDDYLKMQTDRDEQISDAAEKGYKVEISDATLKEQLRIRISNYFHTDMGMKLEQATNTADTFLAAATTKEGYKKMVEILDKQKLASSQRTAAP